MFQLNKLERLSKKRKRVGRGGDRGGNSGRGSKGQKSRSGSNSEIGPGFEGGQMPLSRRLPRRGFNNPSKIEFKIISLSDLDARFEAGDTVDKKTLKDKGLLKGLLKGSGAVSVKVLGNGSLNKKLNVIVDALSASAKQAIEKAGGKVQLIQEMGSGGITT